MFRFPVSGFAWLGRSRSLLHGHGVAGPPGAMRGLHGELSNYNAEPQAARNRSMKKVRFLRFDVHAEAITLPIAEARQEVRWSGQFRIERVDSESGEGAGPGRTTRSRRGRGSWKRETRRGLSSSHLFRPMEHLDLGSFSERAPPPPAFMRCPDERLEQRVRLEGL